MLERPLDYLKIVPEFPLEICEDDLDVGPAAGEDEGGRGRGTCKEAGPTATHRLPRRPGPPNLLRTSLGSPTDPANRSWEPGQRQAPAGRRDDLRAPWS